MQKDNNNSANRRMIKLGMAQSSEESFPSKQDHADRYKKQKFGSRTDADNEQYVHKETICYLQKYYARAIEFTQPKLLSQYVMLRGPFSPIETTVYATTRKYSGSNASIENTSVNNIILDTDLQEPNDRMVVAAAVSTSAKGLTLRNTTVMPLIHGFAPIMAALFAPQVEVHRNATKTLYTSIISGLGYDKKGNKIFSRLPEHDVSINIDVQMDSSDMEKLNKLRYLMSALLFTLPGELVPNFSMEKKAALKQEIKHTLMGLLTRNRKIVDVCLTDDDKEWGRIQVEDLLQCNDVYQDQAIFPMFNFMKLIPEDDQHINSFRNNNQELYAVAFA